jgi:3-deoxy-D-manno-octulosonic-acid transferase
MPGSRSFPSPRLRIALFVYALVWLVALPGLLLYLVWRGRKDVLYRSHLGERFGLHDAAPMGAVWVHAVSLGEMRSAARLVRAFLDRGETVVTTHFTPAGRREAEREFGADIAAGRLRAVWVPFEFGVSYGAFFRTFQPKFGLVMEVEIWPRMIAASRQAGVPLFLCNAQYPKRSFERDRTRTTLRAEILKGLAGAFVKSTLQAERFHAAGIERVAVTGELRFDQPIPAHQLAAGEAARAALATGRPVVAIASSIEGEDPIYLETIAALLADADQAGRPRPLFIYVPRRPERFDEVAGLVAAAGLRVERRSRLFAADLSLSAPPSAPPDVLIGDSLGEMYFYLAMADRVVVGGGFTPKGAHNIIEPLALGKPVITGPHVWTIEYPFAEAEAAGLALSVADAAGLIAALGAPPAVAPGAMERFFADHAGATARTLAALPEVLAESR